MANPDDIFSDLDLPPPSDSASDDAFIDVPATSTLIGGFRVTDLIADYNFLEGDDVNLTALFTTDLNNIDGGTNTSGASLEAKAKGNSDLSAVAGIQLAQANVGGQQPENQVFDAANAKVSATFSSTEFGTQIVLSPGTATDRVSIEDGNLYLVQKAGAVVVVEGVATFYPTLVVAPGIIIPAHKLQTALENAEEGILTTAPDAERGSQSSGGNFAVDHGGIGDPDDSGVSMGDIIV